MLPAAALVAALLSAVGCRSSNEFVPSPPRTVTVAHPVEEEVVNHLDFTGTTEAYEFVDIRARVEGFLESIHFEDGADVDAGQLLYVIDPKPFQARVDEAEAGLALANSRLASARAEEGRLRAEASNAEAQYQRGVRAAQGGGISQGELDDLRTTRDAAVARVGVVQAEIQSAQASIEAAQATKRRAELDLGYTKVTSPISGRVGRTLIDVGNLVGSGQPTQLTTVVRFDPIYAYFNISEVDLLGFIRRREEKGAQTTAEQKARVLLLGLADEEGFPHQGNFSYADLAVDESTGTYLVRGEFPNPERIIPPGAYVRIQVPLEKSTEMLVPDYAIARDQGGSFALVVNSENVVERHPVVLGELYGSMRVVKEGLRLEDRVVVNGLQFARPGATVNAEMSENQAAMSAALE